MHTTNGKNPGFLRKFVGRGGYWKLIKLVSFAVALCVPQIAYSAYDATVANYFTIGALPSSYNNESGWQKDKDDNATYTLIDKGHVKVNTGSGRLGNSFSRGYVVLQDFAKKTIDGTDVLTGIRLCPMQIVAYVDEVCTGMPSGCDNGSGRGRVGHLYLKKLSGNDDYPAVPTCQWFCAKGWTGVGKSNDDSDDWCQIEIDSNKKIDYYNEYGHVNKMQDYSNLTTKYVKENVLDDGYPQTVPYGNETTKNYQHTTGGIKFQYNEMIRQYVIAKDTVGDHGVLVQPAIIRAALTQKYDVTDVNGYPYYDPIGTEQTFCLPGYTGDDCKQISVPVPCGDITKKPALGAAGSDGWRDVTTTDNSGKYQAKGSFECVCPNVADATGCSYKLLGELPKTKCDTDNITSPCYFTLGGKIAYYYVDSSVPSGDSLCRCKPGRYGTAKEYDCTRTPSTSDNGPIMDNSHIMGWLGGGENCKECEKPDFVTSNNLTQDTDWKWSNGGHNSGTKEQMCNVVQIPTGVTDKTSCEGTQENPIPNYSWYNGACYKWIKDSNLNSFILPQERVCGV